MGNLHIWDAPSRAALSRSLLEKNFSNNLLGQDKEKNAR
jgi:hypothetical protein